MKLMERPIGLDILNTLLLDNILIGFNSALTETYFGARAATAYEYLTYHK